MATHSTGEPPMESMKRQKGMMLKMTPSPAPPRLEGVQYIPGKEQRAITNSSKKNEATG